jgi:osmotically-inducible protein OsmY
MVMSVFLAAWCGGEIRLKDKVSVHSEGQAMSKVIFGIVMLVISCANTAAFGQCPPGAVSGQASRDRVQAALHADPYFYDEHVTVSIENDNIVLRGFVFSDWDLMDALRIATRAACNQRVIDDLSVKVGGRR